MTITAIQFLLGLLYANAGEWLILYYSKYSKTQLNPAWANRRLRGYAHQRR